MYLAKFLCEFYKFYLSEMDDSEEVSRCGAMVSRPTRRSGRFQVLPPDVDILVIMINI